ARLLLQKKIPDEHRVNTGRIETAHGIARRAHQRFAEEIERRIVEHRQAGGFGGGVTQPPIQRVLLALYDVQAHHVARQRAGPSASVANGTHAVRRKTRCQVSIAAPTAVPALPDAGCTKTFWNPEWFSSAETSSALRPSPPAKQRFVPSPAISMTACSTAFW